MVGGSLTASHPIQRRYGKPQNWDERLIEAGQDINSDAAYGEIPTPKKPFMAKSTHISFTNIFFANAGIFPREGCSRVGNSMNNFRKLSIFLIFSVSLTAPVSAQAPREIAQDLKAALISISTFKDSAELAAGSGFVISGDGLVATNYHVIEGGDRITVKTSTGETFGRVSVIDADQRRDIAVLRLPTRGLSALEFAALESVEVGDNVYAMGNPLGLEATFSSGIVSADRIIDGVQVFQITAPISSGSSGGPVVNVDGEVIGIASALMEGGQNINFVIPIKYVQGLLDIGATPTPYEKYAQAEWLSSPTQENNLEGISPWVVAKAQGAGYDLSALAERLRELTDPYQEVTFQMVVAIENAQEHGFDWIDEHKTGVASDNGFFTMTSELEKGNYVAIGVCDSDCSELNLYAMAENEKIIGSYEEGDSFAAASFTVHVPQSILIGSQAISCTVEPCVQSLMVLKK